MSGNDPWQAETQEDVDRVRASDITDGSVGAVRALGHRHGRERIGQRGTHSNKRDSSDGLGNTADATQNLGNITNNHGDDADEGESNEEREVAAAVLDGRHKGEQHLPGDGEEVSERIAESDGRGNHVVFADLRAERACLDELAAPGELLVLEEVLDKLVVLLDGRLLLSRQDGNMAQVVLGDLDILIRLLKSNFELDLVDIILVLFFVFTVAIFSIVSLAIILFLRQITVHKSDGNDLLFFTVAEHDDLVLGNVILEVLRVHRVASAVLRLEVGLSLDSAADFTIGTVGTDNLDVDLLLVLAHLELGLLEAESAGEVLVKDGDERLRVIAIKSRLVRVLMIVELNIELEVRLPLIVVPDGNLNLSILVALLKVDNFIERLEIDVSLSRSLNGADTNLLLRRHHLLGDGDVDEARRL